MTAFEERQQVIALVQAATVAGARLAPACATLGLSAHTLQRWQEGETVGRDQRPLRTYAPPHKLTAAERAALLAVANSAEFGHLPPSQIVPRLADQGRYLAGRGQHDALDALAVGVNGTKVNWILDADIRSFFDAVSPTGLMRFLEHRIGDERIIRLVRKWLQAGVLDEGVWSVSEKGTPQGAVVSPLLTNVYLHSVFDLWAARWRRREANGRIIVVRCADDIVVGFEHAADARHFWEAMRSGFERFGLELHEGKARLLEFGRYSAERRERRGLGKPETFTFLGFVFICGRSRRGRFQLQRKTRADRMRARLHAIKAWLRVCTCTRRSRAREGG